MKQSEHSEALTKRADIKHYTIEHNKRALKDGKKRAASRSSSKQSELSEARTKQADIKRYTIEHEKNALKEGRKEAGGLRTLIKKTRVL